MTTIQINEHDAELVREAAVAMRNALEKADNSVAVAKRLAVIAMGHRNRGRQAARRFYPFAGICEASGLPLAAVHAVLDEVEPARGYSGKLRWVCPKRNNSGLHSCGGC